MKLRLILFFLFFSPLAWAAQENGGQAWAHPKEKTLTKTSKKTASKKTNFRRTDADFWAMIIKLIWFSMWAALILVAAFFVLSLIKSWTLMAWLSGISAGSLLIFLLSIVAIKRKSS